MFKPTHNQQFNLTLPGVDPKKSSVIAFTLSSQKVIVALALGPQEHIGSVQRIPEILDR
jgi:hypothetical protein